MSVLMKLMDEKKEQIASSLTRYAIQRGNNHVTILMVKLPFEPSTCSFASVGQRCTTLSNIFGHVLHPLSVPLMTRCGWFEIESDSGQSNQNGGIQ
jgi:hypothetical protein